MKPIARQWYRFTTQADNPAIAELSIFDQIGTSWWNDNAVSAKQFLQDLKALSDAVSTVRVRVNSLGGDPFDAVAIANGLRQWAQAKSGRTVVTSVEGIAASAASIVIMAGSTVEIADNALVMVHNASSIEVGDKRAMRKTADALDKIDGTIVATYQWHSTLSAEALSALMDAETWMGADEAIAQGFATDKVEGLKAAALFAPSAIASLKVPEQYRDRVEAFLATPAAALDVVRECKAAGFADLADELLAANLTLDQVKAKLTEATAAKETAAAAERERTAAATARAEQIRAICKTHGQTARAEFYVTSAKSVDDVKADILTLKAQLDALHIDPTIDPAKGATTAPAAAAIDAGAIYRDRNRPATT